jgi:hypothetical protein
MSQTTQTPQQNLKIIGKTCGSTLARSILNAGNVSIANALRNIAEFFNGAAIGVRGVNLYVSAGGVAANDAVTFSSFTNGNTVTVNGVVFTGETGTPSGVQQFKVGGNDTATALNFAARINNTDGVGAPPAKVFGVVTASAASNVVTLTAVEPGAVGNLYTLAISANGSVTGANFANGTDGTITYLSKGL